MPGKFINSGTNPFGKVTLTNNNNSGNLSISIPAVVAYSFAITTYSSSNQSLACFNGFGGGTEVIYASTNNGASVTQFFTDSGLTTPFVGDTYCYLFEFGYPSGVAYAAYIDGSGNVTGNTAC